MKAHKSLPVQAPTTIRGPLADCDAREYLRMVLQVYGVARPSEATWEELFEVLIKLLDDGRDCKNLLGILKYQMDSSMKRYERTSGKGS